MKNNTVRGAFTIEILFAFTIITLALTGAVMVALGGQVSGMDMNLTSGGLNRESTLYEKNIAHGYSSWSTLASVAASNPALDNGYSTSTTVTNGAPCTKLVTSDVSWSSDKNRSLGASVTTLIASVAEARLFGGTCDPTPGSDWENPGSFDGIDTGGAKGTAVEVAYIGGIRYAFIVSDSGTNDKNDFLVVDSTILNSFVDVASLDTSRGDNDIVGLNDVAYANKTAYVLRSYKDHKPNPNHNVNQPGCQFTVANQLQIIDLTTPAVPVLQPSDVTLDGVNGCEGSDPDGKVVRYYNGKLFIGLRTTLGPEFLIYDVSGANRLTPQFVGKIDNSFNHSVYDLAIRGNYAYLATSYADGEIIVVDITNPALPVVAGVPIDLPDSLTATALAVNGNRLYVGRDRADGAEKDFYVLDITSPATPSIIGSGWQLGTKSGSTVTGLAVQGPHAFVVTDDANKPLFILNISNPLALALNSSCSINWSQSAADIAYSDNLLFVVNRSQYVIRVIYDKTELCEND